MWPCKNKGEDARLYKAVESVSRFAIDLGINIPTGKDSLSMNQKYKEIEVKSPGTVIISATAHCNNIFNIIEPVFKLNYGSIYYINLSSDKFKLGGSAFSQIIGNIGTECPTINDSKYFINVFNTIQELIYSDLIIAGHDIGSGGFITTIMEMCFPTTKISAEIDLSTLNEKDITKILFSENCGIIIQSKNDKIEDYLINKGIKAYKIGKVIEANNLKIRNFNEEFLFDIAEFRDYWFKTSTLLDKKQTSNG